MVMYFSRNRATQKKMAKIKEHPTTTIAELQSGVNEIQGRVSEESTTVVAPMSQTECVWYSFIIEQRHQKNDWKTVVKESRCGEFFVEDGSGTCQIDLNDADLIVDADIRTSSSMFDEPNRIERQVLKDFSDRGELKEALVSYNNYRYTETRLEVGDQFYALGYAFVSNNSRPVFRSLKSEPLIVSDKSEFSLLTELGAAGYRSKAICVGCGILSVFVLLFETGAVGPFTIAFSGLVIVVGLLNLLSSR